MNCPELLKRCKQSYFCYFVLCCGPVFLVSCSLCCPSFSNCIRPWGWHSSVGTDRPICVPWRRKKLWLQNNLCSSMDNQITQQDKLDLIWVLAHAHISVSFPCTYAGFQGCCGRPTTRPDLTEEIVSTSVLNSHQLNELPLGHILCHLARRFLFWFCKPSSQIYCITEQWSEQGNVRFLPVLVKS